MIPDNAGVPSPEEFYNQDQSDQVRYTEIMAGIGEQWLIGTRVLLGATIGVNVVSVNVNETSFPREYEDKISRIYSSPIVVTNLHSRWESLDETELSTIGPTLRVSLGFLIF